MGFHYSSAPSPQYSITATFGANASRWSARTVRAKRPNHATNFMLRTVPRDVNEPLAPPAHDLGTMKREKPKENPQMTASAAGICLSKMQTIPAKCNDCAGSGG